MDIQPFGDSRRDAVVRLSLRAWEPVFASLENVMDPEAYRALHPDWRATQREAVEAACDDDDVRMWVAAEGDETLGFVAGKLHGDDRMGEIYMVAVDPEFQRRGVATALTRHALDWFEDAGMSVAMVETGGDPGHAPARAAYESMGFRRFPVARYFRKL